MNKVTKFKNSKVTQAICSRTRCMNKEHGDQICEAIKIPESTDDHSICYISQLCDAFCFVLDSWERSALHTASLVGKNKVVHYLATHGANVNFQDCNGITPLHCAILSQHIDTAFILLKYGADVNIPDRRNISPANCLSAQQPVKIFHPIKSPIHHGYSWGTNANYNLALASGQAKEVPENFEVPLKKGNTLTTVSMNKFHSVFLSSSGKVFVCGHGQGGRLGLETDSSVVVPQLIKVSSHKIIRISAGVDHTLFLDENNKVFSCGTNKYHQLGFPECSYNIVTPHLLMEWHAKNPEVNILGIAAGAYHSVLWTRSQIFTCGLNAGQLGHIDIHNDTFVDLPKSIHFVKNLRESKVGQISDVAVSDGAIVILTSFGDIIACYEHKVHLIPLKASVVKKIACTGGRIDKNLVTLPTDHKNRDLRIAVLLMSGDLIVWVEKTLHHERVNVSAIGVWNIQQISDFCINSSNLCLVDCHGEVYFGRFEDETYRWRPRIDDENYLYFYSQGMRESKSISKSKKVPHLYRTRFVFSDPRGNNYIAIQYDPKLFMKRRISRTSTSLKQDIADYYSKVTDVGGDYDVEIAVGNRMFPAHAYVLAYHSDVLRYKVVENLKQNCHTTNGKIHLKLDDIDADVFEEILNIFYYRDYKKGKFNEPHRFIRYTSENEERKWQSTNFVHLYRKDEHDISERIKKSRHLKDSQKEIMECLQYPLKQVKELSCLLKMKKLQNALLEINRKDLQSQEISRYSSVLDVYAPSMIYSRDMYPELWDVSFQCEDKIVVKAHRVMLMARSSYFDALLGSRWNQEQGADLVDICIPSLILLPILDYLYTDETLLVTQSNDLEFLCQVLMYSHQYMIEGLHRLCQRSVARLITLKNCFDILKFCHVYHASSLKEVILEFICLNLPYHFDTKICRNLEEETIMDIKNAYQKVVLPYDYESKSRKKLLSCVEENFILHEYIAGKKPNISEVLEIIQGEYVDDIERPKKNQKFMQNMYIRDEVAYIPEAATEDLKLTAVQATSLPTLDDLEAALRKNSYIIHQTPDEWAEEFKETHLSPSAMHKEPNNERKCKSSFRKRRLRKTSSTSQVSTSSSSEPENTLDMKDSHGDFSFDDLEDKLPTDVHTEEDWTVIKKNKHEIDNSHDVQSSFKNLDVQEHKKHLNSDGPSPPPVPVFPPFLDDAPFPTLLEALTVLKKTPPQSKSMPKFQSKSGKKCQKTEKAAAAEEEKLSPAASASCAWGSGSPEKYSSLREVMKREKSFEEISATASSNSPSSKIEQQKGFLQNESQQVKRVTEEEPCHWNPVTHTVVRSPQEANDVSFSSIVEEEVLNIKHIELESNKPLSLIQMEETAIKELLDFYGGEFNPEERVTVKRYGAFAMKPSWNVQHRPL